MKKMNKKGFTIVELVIVIAVIAILAAVMIPTFSGIIEKANVSRAIQEGRNVYTQAYADDLSDGIIDGAVKGDNAWAKPAGYTVDTTTNKVTAFTYACSNGYTATLDMTDNTWSADKTE